MHLPLYPQAIHRAVFSNDLLKYRVTAFITCASYCKVLAKRWGGRGDVGGGRTVGYSTYFSALLLESDGNVDMGWAELGYCYTAALFLIVGMSPVLRLFCFSALSCHFLLKTPPPSLRQKKQERISKCLYISTITLEQWVFETPCPSTPKSHFYYRPAFLLVHYIPASATLPTDTHPDALASLMDACLFLSHQSSSVEPLCNQTFLLICLVYIFSVLPAFPFFLVGILGWICFSLVFACFVGHYHTCQRIILYIL